MQVEPLHMAGKGQDEYAATLAKVTRILKEREHLYASAHLHIPLSVSPEDPGEHGASPADVAYRYLLSIPYAQLANITLESLMA